MILVAALRALERATRPVPGGITHYLAHNMTVTPRNLDQVADVVRDCRSMGFRMFSFQPAAYIGNANRWKDEYRSFSGDEVWAEVERGAGSRLPYRVFQMGDERCNRTCHGVLVGQRIVPLVDDRVAADHAVRDAFYTTFGGMDFQAPLLVPRASAGASSRGAGRGRPLGRALRGPRRDRAAAARPAARTDLRDALVHGRARRTARLGGAPARGAQ
jgi:hypothetical protein